MRLIKINILLFLCIFIIVLLIYIKINNNTIKTDKVNFTLEKKVIALTFDDGPEKETEELLNELRLRNVKVTFFVLGEKALKYPNIIKKIHKDHHQIGNHTYNHKILSRLKNSQIHEQIEKTNEAVENIIGKKPEILRPSYGSVNKKVLRASQMPIVLWSVDTKDWKIQNARKIYKNNINKIKDGDIILMHDIFKSSIEGSLMLIDELLKEGFEFVTINDLAEIKGVELKENEKYYRF